MKPDLLASHGKYQFSLPQSWVSGTMKVAWLLAAFIALVTYTARLTCSGQVMFWDRDLKLKLDQSDVNKMTQKKVLFLFLKIKGLYKVLKITTRLSGFNDYYNFTHDLYNYNINMLLLIHHTQALLV